MRRTTSKSPPRLPIERPAPSWRVVRVLLIGLAQALTLLLLGCLLDGLSVDGLLAAIAAVAVLNALFIRLAAQVVDGITVSSFWTALFVALWLTVVNLTVGGLLNIGDDQVWRQRIVQRLVRRTGAQTQTDVAGFLFVQIDGLGHDVLVEAMASGHAPLLARLVESGTHQLLDWECDLSSQTGAMQAGILLGDNHNMPAFRWYEKELGRVFVTNRPNDAAELESQPQRVIEVPAEAIGIPTFGAAVQPNGGVARDVGLLSIC